jgi:hypothetical protein
VLEGIGTALILPAIVALMTAGHLIGSACNTFRSCR